ncbi:9745_t:CDS:2, partial [Entrophospora sp. SA101]
MLKENDVLREDSPWSTPKIIAPTIYEERTYIRGHRHKQNRRRQTRTILTSEENNIGHEIVNVGILYSPQRVGSIYFKTLFAVNIFGVCKTGEENCQLSYIIADGINIDDMQTIILERSISSVNESIIL